MTNPIDWLSDAQAEAMDRARDPSEWHTRDLCYSDDPPGWDLWRARRLAVMKLAWSVRPATVRAVEEAPPSEESEALRTLLAALRRRTEALQSFAHAYDNTSSRDPSWLGQLVGLIAFIDASRALADGEEQAEGVKAP